MPRPTAAQLIFGSATVISAAVAMLLLSRATGGLAIAAICTTSLVLGLFVALTTAPRPRTRAADGTLSAARVPQQDLSAAHAGERRPVGARSASR